MLSATDGEEDVRSLAESLEHSGSALDFCHLFSEAVTVPIHQCCELLDLGKEHGCGIFHFHRTEFSLTRREVIGSLDPSFCAIDEECATS